MTTNLEPENYDPSKANPVFVEVDTFLRANGWSDTGGGNNFTTYERGYKRNKRGDLVEEGRTIYAFIFEEDRGPNDSHYLEINEEGLPIRAGFFFQEGEDGIAKVTREALAGGKGLTRR